MVRKIRLYFFGVVLFIGMFSGFSFLKLNFCLGAEDLMEKAFTPAREYETIIDMGNTKNAVGNDVLREGISISLEGGLHVEKRTPLIVRITKLLLRLTIVLSITMVIYSGINYILQSTSGGDTKKSTKDLMLIVGGVVLALLSLAIIQLINSFTVNSLNLESFSNVQSNSTDSLNTGVSAGGGGIGELETNGNDSLNAELQQE